MHLLMQNIYFIKNFDTLLFTQLLFKIISKIKNKYTPYCQFQIAILYLQKLQIFNLGNLLHLCFTVLSEKIDSIKIKRTLKQYHI